MNGKENVSKAGSLLMGITIKIAGEAGSGVTTIGLALCRAMKNLGMHVFSENDYPSLIRGGHNTVTVRASPSKIHCLSGPVHLLICLNRNAATRHNGELAEGGIVIYDGEAIKLSDGEKKPGISYVSAPLSRIAKEEGNPLFENSAAIGAALSMLGADPMVAQSEMQKSFGKKGREIVEKNIAAARKGAESARQGGQKAISLPFGNKLAGQILLNGNDAICLGALRAGCKFVAEYPMSPSSSVLHWMAAYERDFGMVVKHTEDEIAAMNMICGAAFTGVRAITATSGGGFSLMVEALGMAGISEQPVVVVEVQRCGPSTGLPTYTEQADLQFAIHASQGEFPRLVYCPGDVEECFYGMIDVMNWSEKLQAPAIVLSDKYLAEQYATVPRFDMKKAKIERGKRMADSEMEKVSHWMGKGEAGKPVFKRHAFTQDGISPQCFPGQENGMYVASSYEHDETGFTSEEPDMRIAMIDKRAKKLESVPQALIKPKIYGNRDSDFLLISWGSTKNPCLEALQILERQGFKVKFMHISWASPFDSLSVLNELQKSKKQLICEGNSNAQMRALIREKTGFLVKNTLLKYDGRPFIPEQIAEEVKRLY